MFRKDKGEEVESWLMFRKKGSMYLEVQKRKSKALLMLWFLKEQRMRMEDEDV